MTTGESIKVAVEVITVILAVIAFVHGQRVYREQKARESNALESRNTETARENTLKRFEKYQQMQKRYREDASIQAVFRDLYPDFYGEGEKPAAPASMNDKLNFMGFYEELEIMIRSRLMNRELAYYTFGVDALTFWNEETQFHNEPAWLLFKSFAEGVRGFQEEFPNNPGQITALKY
jgi:hypothetical protein